MITADEARAMVEEKEIGAILAELSINIKESAIRGNTFIVAYIEIGLADKVVKRLKIVALQ